jgi:subtilase family serine protease
MAGRSSVKIRTQIGMASLALALATSAGANAATEKSVALKGNVAQWVKQAKLVGPADESQTVSLTFYLGFRKLAEMQALATAVATPGSASYGAYLTPAEFQARFAPDAATVAAAQAAIAKLGFAVGHKAPSGFYIQATGTVKQLKAAFHVSQNLYSFAGKTMRANAEEPQLPASLGAYVTAIAGLDETGQLIRPAHVMTRDAQTSRETHTINTAATALRALAATGPGAPPPVAAGIPLAYCSTYWGDHSAVVTPIPSPFAKVEPWAVCGYTPQQIRAAYGINKVALDGTGVRVAIVDAYASPTIGFDANRYSSLHGLPQLNDANFKQIIPAGIYGVSASEICGPQNWYTEETLDVEAVHSIAPHAFITYIGSRDCLDSIDDALFDAIENHVADVITNSWGEGGEFDSTAFLAVEDKVFQEASILGITVVFSSGDDGDLSQLNGIASGSAPATSPFVTGVGGTSLALMKPDGTKREWGWGTYRAFLDGVVVNSAGTQVSNIGLEDFSFYGGAGGGPSLYFAEPSYQLPVVPSAYVGGTYTSSGYFVPLIPAKRSTPDVALDADPYTGFLIGETYTIAGDPIADYGCTAYSKTLEYCETGIGGTSLASPLFAGVVALVDQYRFAHRRHALGFANPRLYRVRVGEPSSTLNGLVDVRPPGTPTSMLRGYLGDPYDARVVAINSLPSGNCPSGICEGVDDIFLQTATGYDDVTGLGTPYAPVLITTLGTP